MLVTKRIPINKLKTYTELKNVMSKVLEDLNTISKYGYDTRYVWAKFMDIRDILYKIDDMTVPKGVVKQRDDIKRREIRKKYGYGESK